MGKHTIGMDENISYKYFVMTTDGSIMDLDIYE